MSNSPSRCREQLGELMCTSISNQGFTKRSEVERRRRARSCMLSKRSSYGPPCFAEQDVVQSSLSCHVLPKAVCPLPNVDTNREEKVRMKSQSREASLFRSRGSVMRFWLFQRSDLAAQRGLRFPVRRAPVQRAGRSLDMLRRSPWASCVQIVRGQVVTSALKTDRLGNVALGRPLMTGFRFGMSS